MKRHFDRTARRDFDLYPSPLENDLRRICHRALLVGANERSILYDFLRYEIQSCKDTFSTEPPEIASSRIRFFMPLEWFIRNNPDCIASYFYEMVCMLPEQDRIAMEVRFGEARKGKKTVDAIVRLNHDLIDLIMSWSFEAPEHMERLLEIARGRFEYVRGAVLARPCESKLNYRRTANEDVA